MRVWISSISNGSKMRLSLVQVMNWKKGCTVLYCNVLYCTVLYCTHLEGRVGLDVAVDDPAEVQRQVLDGRGVHHAARV